MAIEYIQHKDIDKNKWDECIVQSVNSLLYVRSFYLDNIADNWDALVLDDYKAVMPLIWRKKWGIKYLYQPSFVPQQGIFFREDVDPSIAELFVGKALGVFKYADITLNYLNNNLRFKNGVAVSVCANYILPLHLPYEELYKNYHHHFTKSLRRINKFNFNYLESSDINGVIALYSSLYLNRIKSITEKDIVGFKNICFKLSAENNLVIREVLLNEKLLAVVLLLKDQSRLYNMISCITEDGKRLEANYFLYDKLIQEFSSQRLCLDLEGSDINGVAAFYKKFNPVNQTYLHLKQNKLSPIIKLFRQ